MGGYQTRIDTGDDDMLAAILGAIAAVENVPQTELPTLYDTLEPNIEDGCSTLYWFRALSSSMSPLSSIGVV